MTQSNHLTNLNDQEIEKLCQGESAKRSSNPRPSYCFELFRRAIEDKSQAAWDAIHKQYQAMIRGWINADNVDQDDLFQKSFTKFLEAFEKENDLSKFKTIGSILGFWRKTTKNIVIDHLRAIERERRGIDEIAKIFPIHQTGFDEVQLDMQTFIRRIKDQLKDEVPLQKQSAPLLNGSNCA